MYEFIQTETGWQIYWGLPSAERTESTEMTIAAGKANAPKEVMVRSQAAEPEINLPALCRF